MQWKCISNMVPGFIKEQDVQYVIVHVVIPSSMLQKVF